MTNSDPPETASSPECPSKTKTGAPHRRKALSLPLHYFSHFLLFLLCLFLFLPSSAFSQGPPLRIAVISDADTPEIRAFVEEILTESQTLLGKNRTLRIPENGLLFPGTGEAAILGAYATLAGRKDADLILALGGFSAPVLAGQSAFSKPLIALGVVDARLQHLPLTADGSSGKKHFTYLVTPGSLEGDIRTFHRLTGFRRLAVFIESPILVEKATQAVLENLSTELGIAFVFPPPFQEDQPSPIPQDCDAVLLGGLYRYPQPLRRAILQEAIHRRLPLFSLKGESDVREGALAGALPETEWQRLARLLALRVEAWASDGDLSRIPVTMEADTHIYLNLATAKAIGFSPAWDILTEARIAVPEPRTGEARSFTDLVHEALKRHNAILQAEENLHAATARGRAAAAGRLPSLGAEVRGQIQDRDHSIGGAAEKTAEVAATVRQVLFADQINTAVYTGERERDQAKARLEQARLDAVLDVGGACLELLRSRSLLRIREDTAGHTRKNLDIASQRRDVGYTGRAEVLRWENALARARQSLLAAVIAVEQAENGLKRRLGWPLDQEIHIRDAGSEEAFFTAASDIPLSREIRTPQALERFSLFLEREAENLRPEALVLQAALAAATREEAFQKRRAYTPEVALAASAAHVLDRSGEGSHIPLPADDRWQVGVQASWTLYSGGEIRASQAAARAGVRRLELEKEETLRRIREDVRNRLADVVAALFDLDFARQAAQASQDNLALVQDAYTKGAASIVDLMDARNADIEARESEAVVHYALLMARLKLQHALGFYPALSSSRASAAFLDRYREYAR
ncbi:TolC family protein [Desulfobotulus sp.]|uniref:TolC family protein n=1 Tax=Desulfobotulus sp. TaxID=1940337 RepID=UPI002A369742|nr:TolC family protein [Desulfobotulus sp.]MDY0164544.1 TolC family protein [Desulfobotulus sp.]